MRNEGLSSGNDRWASGRVGSAGRGTLCHRFDPHNFVAGEQAQRYCWIIIRNRDLNDPRRDVTPCDIEQSESWSGPAPPESTTTIQTKLPQQKRMEA